MAQSIALRPALPADAAALAALFRASVETLGAEDYSEAQVEAWSALADDEAEFGQKLAQKLTIIASVGDQWSDLDGGYAERVFKLPNPFYFIP